MESVKKLRYGKGITAEGKLMELHVQSCVELSVVDHPIQNVKTTLVFIQGNWKRKTPAKANRMVPPVQQSAKKTKKTNVVIQLASTVLVKKYSYGTGITAKGKSMELHVQWVVELRGAYHPIQNVKTMFANIGPREFPQTHISQS